MQSQRMMNKDSLFTVSYKNFGTILFKPLEVLKDSTVIHNWVTKEYAYFWGMQGSSLKDVQKEYNELINRDAYDVFLGIFNNEPIFLLECYHPLKDEIANHYNAKISDYGVHIIVAPPSGKIVHNFTWYIFKAITDFVFKNSDIDRILVEPDIRNKKMFAICQRIGFILDKVIELPHKTAQLAFLNRTTYLEQKHNSKIQKRSIMNTIDNAVTPQQSIAHITPEVWKKVNLFLIKKAICEFHHELLIQIESIKRNENGWNVYVLKTTDNQVYYQFEAKILALNHLYIKTASIQKRRNDNFLDLDAINFIKEFKDQLGISSEMMPMYLEEIISTLYGSAYKLTKGNLTSKELAHANFQTIEQSMTEGHPGFVANNGRIGFNSSEYRSYAPEVGNSFSIMWLAGHKSVTVYSGIAQLSYETLISKELDNATIDSFYAILEEKGLNINDYYFIPVHPWQWYNKLATIFTPEIAQGRLVCLGYGQDQYLAQQSIRTLFNISNPEKHYVKSALSILNMGFMRGLPLYYLGTAPKMAVWLEELLYKDSFIQKTGFKMLGEIASVSYVNSYYEEFGVHNDYNKMLASLWRESPYTFVNEQQEPMTMAAFLHIDQYDEALLPEIIKASGVTTDVWLQHYFQAYLSPLLHCFYHYDLVFMPHGENIIMVLENHIPKSILLKDITEEAVILSPDVKLPEHLKRMYAPVPEDVKLLSVFTDIFDGFFRFMAHILEEHICYPEQQFWKLVAENILAYQRAYPQHKDKYVTYDLFAPDFQLSCLNRLQLNNNKQMIDLDDPVALLQFAGRLVNPIAIFKEQAATI